MLPQLMSWVQAQPGGWKGWHFTPSPILGTHFRFKLLSTTIFHLQNSMKMNSIYMLWMTHVGSTRVIFKSQGPILGSRGPNIVPEGPLESKVGEKLVFIFGRETTRPGGPSMANFTPVTRARTAPLAGPACVYVCSAHKGGLMVILGKKRWGQRQKIFRGICPK